MATPRQLREAIAALSALAERDLASLFRQAGEGPQIRAALLDLLPALVDTYGAAAATVAADWYDELRDEYGATKRFTAIPAEIPDTGATGLVDWAKKQATNTDAMQSLIAGGLQKRIANASRKTVTASSIADPGADGWLRVGFGSCGFCAMLIDRGAVYSQEGVDFGAHDHCNCQAAPHFKGAEPVDVRKYVPSKRDIPQADKDRAKAWIAANL